MTTPLIPLKSILAGTRYTPAELTEDAAFETYLLGLPTGQGISFIRAIMQAYRAGSTSVVFGFTSSTIADNISDYLLTGPTSYGYSITVSDNSITVSWA